MDDISVLPNYRTVGDAISDYDSCGNTQKITQKGAADIYPAAWAAVDYAPSAAPETKGKWCLPAAGIWNSAFINFDIITSTLAIIRAKPLMQNYWGSSEHDYGFAWEFCTDIDACSKGIGFSAKKISQHIRPVIEF